MPREKKEDKTVKSSKLIWETEKESQFLENLSHFSQDIWNHAMSMIDCNINQALEMFVDSLKCAAECMMKTCFDGKITKTNLWFDDECCTSKIEAHRLLKVFKQTKTQQDRLTYLAARKCYKKLIKTKKTTYKREKARRLASFGKDSRSFWKELKQLSARKRNELGKSVTEEQWYNHFRCLFRSGDIVNGNVSYDNEETNENRETLESLNCPISEEEVRESVRKLKKGKAHGIDGVSAEMIKTSGDMAITFLTRLFNAIFDKGIYPDDWSKAIIVPIFKKGDKDTPDNYRGVSLLSLLSKCYTYILNKRLVKWTEEEKIISENQAGFRKGYSTFDHIFTLNAIIEKCLSKRGGKLYTCFVDLKKAFDSVQRGPLIDILLKNGLSGKFCNSIVAMYKSVISCVRLGDRYTDFFDCPVGVRQGCILSPTLFSIFIDEISRLLAINGMHGIQLMTGMLELFILLFADDIVLMSDTPRGLQNQLDILNLLCKELFLTVNTEKTKVMVFRKGGILGRFERWNLDGKNLEVVNEYNYLGYVFSTKLSVIKSVDVLAAKGKHACFECVKYISKLNEITKTCFFKIFDSQVQSVLLYAAEIWGLHRMNNIEKVHTFACKRFLNIPLKVPNKFVFGELGRYPMFVNSAIKCIRYWFKLIEMGDSRLPKQAYIMLLAIDEKGKKCWATRVREFLFELGFGYVWLQQSVGDKKAFISVLRRRLKDTYQQEWNSSMRNKDMYSHYRMFKLEFESEKYFDYVDIKCFRDYIIKLRLGILPLNGSAFRISFLKENNMCKYCNTVENERHFVLICPLYNCIRRKYLGEIRNNSDTYCKILSCVNMYQTRRLGMFLFYACRVRNDYIDNMISVGN